MFGGKLVHHPLFLLPHLHPHVDLVKPITMSSGLNIAANIYKNIPVSTLMKGSRQVSIELKTKAADWVRPTEQAVAQTPRVRDAVAEHGHHAPAVDAETDRDHRAGVDENPDLHNADLSKMLGKFHSIQIRLLSATCLAHVPACGWESGSDK